MTDGGAPIYVASQQGHLAVFRVMCEAGAKQHQAITFDRTSLYLDSPRRNGSSSLNVSIAARLLLFSSHRNRSLK